MAKQQDPYYELRPVIENAVSKLATDISKQEHVLGHRQTSNFLSKITKLKKLNDQLGQAINMATQHRTDRRYRHIDSQEIASRTRFVEGIRKRLDDLDSYLHGDVAKNTSPRSLKKTSNTGGRNIEPMNNEEHNSPFQSISQRRGNSERARSFEKESLLRDSLAQQNEDIDYIADRVSEMNEHARAIGNEVDDHNRMLEEMHKSVDKLNATFDAVNNKIGEFAQTKDNCIVKVILYLSITAFLLLILIIFV